MFPVSMFVMQCKLPGSNNVTLSRYPIRCKLSASYLLENEAGSGNFCRILKDVFEENFCSLDFLVREAAPGSLFILWVEA